MPTGGHGHKQEHKQAQAQQEQEQEHGERSEGEHGYIAQEQGYAQARRGMSTLW